MNKVIISLALVASLPWSAGLVAAAAQSAKDATAPKSPAVSTTHKTLTHRAAGLPGSARQYYAMTWGVDQLSAKLAESGQLVRFNYRVVDALKAGALNSKAASPLLIDNQAKVQLQVPSMEKIGPLRQSMTPENGKTYWMVFSNKGRLVKAGHRVSVVIGPFRVDGLIVQN